jgi:phage terminase large subunit-like protein
MTGILDKFYVEHGVHGAKVTARTLQLTAACTSETEIEESVQMLKEDLDACEREMKRLVRLNRGGSPFEGWPSAKDQVLEA